MEPAGLNVDGSSTAVLGVVPSMSRKGIYQKIDDVICKVMSNKGSATGVLIGNKVVVPFHVVPLVELSRDESANTTYYRALNIKCIYQGVLYEAKYVNRSMQADYNADCAIFMIEDDHFSTQQNDSIEIFREIEPGEQVYFGGFPLGQYDPIFHSGFVSSVSDKNGRRSFCIDGTVVPGNSGSPVFVMRENRLKLAGLVSAQIADFNEEDRKTIAIMKHLEESGKNNPKTGTSGVITSITVTTGSRTEIIEISDRTIINSIFGLIERNLSTGIGRALGAQHLIDVFNGITVPIDPVNVMPVMRGEPLPGMLSKNPDYLDWYHQRVKNKPSLCAAIIGRPLGAADHISAEEEKILWEYYNNNPLYKGFNLSDEESLDKLIEKIQSAKPKAVRLNRERWQQGLQLLGTKLLQLEHQDKIKGAMALLS